MTEEAFLAAIRDDPNDNTNRLVYADWLDEQGRPGGEFLRIDCRIAELDPAEFERREQERAKLLEEGVIDFPPPDILDSYYWRRVHLVAEMRCATSDLEDDWMAAVSRVPIAEINARSREIQSWLQRRVAVAEAPSGALRWEKPPPAPTGLWQRFLGVLGWAAKRPADPLIGPDPNWAAEYMRPGDELWEYNTGGDSWANLCGEMGYAILRKGKVVEHVTTLEN